MSLYYCNLFTKSVWKKWFMSFPFGCASPQTIILVVISRSWRDFWTDFRNFRGFQTFFKLWGYWRAILVRAILRNTNQAQLSVQRGLNTQELQMRCRRHTPLLLLSCLQIICALLTMITFDGSCVQHYSDSNWYTTANLSMSSRLQLRERRKQHTSIGIARDSSRAAPVIPIPQ